MLRCLGPLAVAAALTVHAPSAGALTASAPVRVETMISGLTEPWAIGFLPDGGVLVTERGGALRHLTADGRLLAVSGLPEVAASGQGGLLDLLVPRDFARTRALFLTFAAPQGRGAGTAVFAARLAEDGTRLEDGRVIFESVPGFSGGRHFGSRLAEAPDGTLFLTTGDRGADRSAQDLSVHNGKVLRIGRDGAAPRDNPFAGRPDARPEIWSYGHRNPQGLAFDAAGRLWLSEHGPRGGDEVNLVEPGRNYGWPITTHGRAYSGLPIGVGPTAPGIEPPRHVWVPSIAPSGHMIYSGRLWPQWAGHHFLGSLNSDFIARLDPAANWAEERIRGRETARVRDVREAPDGSIWFLSVGNGAAYRITPAVGG